MPIIFKYNLSLYYFCELIHRWWSMTHDDLTGKKYGKLHVVDFSHQVGYQRYWNCICDCGAKTIVNGGNLRRGIPSCGCNRFNNLFGTRYGKLLALGRVTERTASRGLKWKCRCDCGKVVVVTALALRGGLKKSCGCDTIANIALSKTTHGKSKTKIYKTWNSMNMRCKPGEDGHPDYGQRGIRVCDEWANSFEAFYTYVGDKPKGKSLDRIDPDGNYEPGNVRWVDQTTQLINRRVMPNNKSGVTGVSVLQSGKYLAELKIYGKRVLKKEFNTLEEARLAREEAELLHHKPLLDAK